MYVIVIQFMMHKHKHIARTNHILCTRFVSGAIFTTNRFNMYRPIIYFFITICIIRYPSSDASLFSLRTNAAPLPPPSLIRPLHHISAYFSLVKRIPSHSSRAQISPVSLIQPRPDELSRPMSASLSSAEVLSALRKVMYTQSSIPSAFSKSAQSRAAHRDSLYFSAHHFNSPSASRADFISTKLIIIQPTSV